MRNSIVIIFFLISLSVFSQKEMKDISFSGYGVPVHYWQYPSHPLGDDFETFSVNVGSDNPFIVSYLRDRIKIARFDQLETGGDIQIRILVPDFTFKEVEKKEHEVLDKDGKLRDRYYTLRIIYTYAIEAVVRNGRTGEKLFERKWDTSHSSDIWAREYRDEHEFNISTTSERIDKIKNDIMQDVFGKTADGISNECTFNYSISSVESKDNLLRMNEDDYYEHYFYLKQMQDLSAIFKKMDLMIPLTDFQDELDPIMSYLESIIVKYENKSPKVVAKVAAASYYNLGMIYFYMDDPDKALIYGQKVMDTKEFGFEGKNLIRKTEELSNILKLNNITSRHGQLQ